jgi:hypothetical protein
VEAHRYLELARREGEFARNAHERSEAAQRFALRQVDEGLREYFLRVAGRAKMDSLTHAARARRFEAIASKCRATPAAADGSDRPKAAIGWRGAGILSCGAARDTERAMSQANVELVKQVLAACLRDDFDVALEHLPERTADRRSTARKQAAIVP